MNEKIRARKNEDEDEMVIAWARTLISRAIDEDEAFHCILLKQGRSSAVRLTTCHDDKLSHIQQEAAQAGSRYSAIFSSPPARRFLCHILKFSSHFRPTKYFRLAGLDPFTDIHGGVRLLHNDMIQAFICPY
jgi:hypothetical protein